MNMIVTDAPDIIDEAIDFFRANVLFRNYKSNGPADLQIAYLTIYISECLRILQKHKNKKDGLKNIITLSMSGNFAVPGEKGFPLPGFFRDPPNRGEAGRLAFPQRTPRPVFTDMRLCRCLSGLFPSAAGGSSVSHRRDRLQCRRDSEQVVVFVCEAQVHEY